MSEDLLRELSVEQLSSSSMITVMGVGGAGGNAVNHMCNMGIEGVNFLICNTDQQALDKSSISNKMRLGHEGLGAGNDPEEGRRAAVESLEEVRCKLESLNTRMLFITAGMGGGTGTGASPTLAKLAHEMGILTVGIVTSPLIVEGNIRYNQALVGIEELRESVDSLLVLNNENILKLYGSLPLKTAFSKADDILCSAAKGIAEIITVESDLVNVDFADVCKVMRASGRAHMSVVSADGANRASQVAIDALNSPLLDNNNISGAENILLNFSVAKAEDLVLSEVTEVMTYIQEHAKTTTEDGKVVNANIIWGTSEKPHLGAALELVLVATGLKEGRADDPSEDKTTDDEPTPVTPEVGKTPREPMALDPAVQPHQNLEAYKPQKPRTFSTPASQVGSRQVILGEPSSKYRNIDNLLSQPAYKLRNSKFIVDTVSAPRRETLKNSGHRSDAVVDDNLLFPAADGVKS